MLRREFLSASSALLASHLLPIKAQAQRNSEKPYRVGVIGHTGRGNYGHGLDTVWLQLPQTEVVAVADADPKGLADAQKRLPTAKPFAHYRDMVLETKPDIVAVAPRHVDQHLMMITAAIDAGVRGIYVEKPFVRSTAEAREVVARCKERGVRLAIAHRNRYHPALPPLAEFITSGKLGTPIEIRGRGKEDHRGGGLDLWVLGSHILNLAVFLAGNPLSCSAGILQNERPATEADLYEGDEGVGLISGNEIHARFDTEKGIPIFFDSKKNFGDGAANFGLQVICTRGVADLRIDTEPLVHVRMGNPFKPDLEPRAWIPFTSAGLGSPEPIQKIRSLIGGHQQPVLDLISAMESHRDPLCGPEDGLLIVSMIESVFASHARGGSRVALR